MNVTGFSDNENNDSFAGNRSVGQYDVQQQQFDHRAASSSITTIMFYVACSLGIPGNILSAIVWIRRHRASENPSAIYLSVLAIVDVVYLTSWSVAEIFAMYRFFYVSLLFLYINGLTMWLEPLLVLSFSVVRLIAIRRPLQANVMCATKKTKKIIVGLALTISPFVAIEYSPFLYSIRLFPGLRFVLHVVLPVTVLVINLMLVCEMRRASNAAANLGLQQHQQSQSAVPTVMLVSTSLVYVLLQVPWGIAVIYIRYVQSSGVFFSVTHALFHFIYSYNFFVYLITGKQFRSDLRSLFYRCSCSCSSFSSPFTSSSSAAAAAHNSNDIELAERGQADSDV